MKTATSFLIFVYKKKLSLNVHQSLIKRLIKGMDYGIEWRDSVSNFSWTHFIFCTYYLCTYYYWWI